MSETFLTKALFGNLLKAAKHKTDGNVNVEK